MINFTIKSSLSSNELFNNRSNDSDNDDNDNKDANT